MSTVSISGQNGKPRSAMTSAFVCRTRASNESDSGIEDAGIDHACIVEKSNVLCQRDSELQKFLRVSVRLCLGVNPQDRFRAGLPRSMSHEESSATYFTPSKAFMSASGERSNFTRWIFLQKIHERGTLSPAENACQSARNDAGHNCFSSFASILLTEIFSVASNSSSIKSGSDRRRVREYDRENRYRRFLPRRATRRL